MDRCIQGCIFHVQLEKSNSTAPEELLCLTERGLLLPIRVAVFYGSIDLVSNSFDYFVLLYCKQYLPGLGLQQRQEFLNLAVRIKLDWLFKDVACRMIGDFDEEYTNGTMMRTWDSDDAGMIFSKKEGLYDAMDHIKNRLLVLKIRKKPHDHLFKVAISANTVFRAELKAHMDTTHLEFDDAELQYDFFEALARVCGRNIDKPLF